MITPVSHATQPQAAAQTRAVTAPATQTKAAVSPEAPHAQPAANLPAAQPKPPAPVDTVHISAAAQALQETLESSAQTTREASAGDIQAQHLLARQAAEKVIR